LSSTKVLNEEVLKNLLNEIENKPFFFSYSSLQGKIKQRMLPGDEGIFFVHCT